MCGDECLTYSRTERELRLSSFSVGACRPHIGTTGADCTAQLIDMRLLGPTCQPFASIKLTDFPYCQALVHSLLLVGCGDGAVLVIDAVSGRIVYGLGVATAAVRGIVASAGVLLCVSDDGTVSLHDFG